MRWWGTRGDLALVLSPGVNMLHFHLGARALIVMAVTCGLAEARPLHVRHSFPAAEAILDGRNAQYIVRFDGWVDHCASQMDVTETGRSSNPSSPLKTASPMFSPHQRPHCLRADTSFIGTQNRFRTATSQTGSSPLLSPGDFAEDCHLVLSSEAVIALLGARCSL